MTSQSSCTLPYIAAISNTLMVFQCKTKASQCCQLCPVLATDTPFMPLICRIYCTLQACICYIMNSMKC
jgi:hypothetical protein